MSRTLIVGDVHGCAAELARLVALASPTRLVLLGDLFTNGPDPEGVWRLVREHDAEAVLGNHDDWVLRHRARWSLRLPVEAIDWLAALPLTIAGDGWLAVHAGVHPQGGATTRDQAITLRRWPDDSDDAHPFWWELYSGSALVIHGHDAARGLVDRRPHTLGLDTGCVYGGRLSGYLLEEDRILGVSAERVYKPIKTGSTK